VVQGVSCVVVVPPEFLRAVADRVLLVLDVMKFHYFSQLLVDSNCLLLILKMFGMQEVSTLVRIKHEKPDYKFVSEALLRERPV
jgi:hypothetical protein